jgi:hypothetical protein
MHTSTFGNIDISFTVFFAIQTIRIVAADERQSRRERPKRDKRNATYLVARDDGQRDTISPIRQHYDLPHEETAARLSAKRIILQ